MGLYGLGIVFAPGVGPVLGGYLVEYGNWRLIFYINVPIGILGAVAAALVLPQFLRAAGRRFDVLGFLTVGGGLRCRWRPQRAKPGAGALTRSWV